MKKFVSIALALVLALSLSVVAFAAAVDYNGTEKAVAEDFTASYTVAPTETSDAIVYGVALAWNRTAFACTWTEVYKWNPADLDYTTLESENGAWNFTDATVTVTNRSNTAIQFTVESDDDDLVVENVAAVFVASAAEDKVEKTGTAKVKFNRAAAKDGEQAIATVTVTITPAAQ